MPIADRQAIKRCIECNGAGTWQNPVVRIWRTVDCDGTVREGHNHRQICCTNWLPIRQKLEKEQGE